MNIVYPKVMIVTKIDPEQILQSIEDAGRICYRSAPHGDSRGFVKRLIDRGHESVLEHVYLTFDIECDRGVSHELVRHRIASYSQESTRYVNYSKDDIEFVMPADIYVTSPEYEIWEKACKFSERFYKELLSYQDVTPQMARSVLNNSVKTKIRMTMNLRSLRNMFRLRCGKPAHPDMKLIMISLLLYLRSKIPVIFDDISYDNEFANKWGLKDEYEDYIEEV